MTAMMLQRAPLRQCRRSEVFRQAFGVSSELCQGLGVRCLCRWTTCCRCSDAAFFNMQVAAAENETQSLLEANGMGWLEARLSNASQPQSTLNRPARPGSAMPKRLGGANRSESVSSVSVASHTDVWNLALGTQAPIEEDESVEPESRPDHPPQQVLNRFWSQAGLQTQQHNVAPRTLTQSRTFDGDSSSIQEEPVHRPKTGWSLEPDA